ncbi:hypothetical protein G7046_g5313 [Stylonectria norvegica]|nr:hypothetical protein G7046_g5313 [Stylonectria norvegica]
MPTLTIPADSPLANLMLNKRFSRTVVIAFTFVIVTAALIWHERVRVAGLVPMMGREEEKPPGLYPFTTTSSFFPVSINPKGKTTEELCASFPKHLLETIQPVLKMGHGESLAKIGGQLDSVSACFGNDDLLIVSDLEETIRDYHVIDILADLPAGYYSDEPDFQHYLWQKEMKANGTLDKDKEATARISGWNLDKYKFLPMVERAWKSKPNKDFYFFFETDTYVFWDNTFRFLQTFDPETPLYMGSPSPGRHDPKKNDVKTWFANGGEGFVLSRGAIKALLHRKVGSDGRYLDPPLTEKWLPSLKGECCGDSLMGWAMWNVSVPLSGYWPLFNPHPLHRIPYSDPYWCQPVMALHKSTPEDMVDVWRWEFGQRQLDRPTTYADLWNFRHPGKPEVKENWDNGDWDSWVAPPDAAVDSFDACKTYCQEHDDCMQFNWRGRDEQKCLLTRTIQSGKARQPEKMKELEEKDDAGNVIPTPPDRKPRWTDFKAGWMPDRIDKWRESRDCSTVQWVGPSIERIF